MGPKAGIDAVKKKILHLLEIDPGRPARNYTD
jgi:hypothetical protein